MQNQVIATKLKELHNFYAKAEKIIKKIQIDSTKLDIPPVNELRYAGRHILNALVGDNEEYCLSELAQAEDHLKRSIFDGLELAHIYYFSILFKIKEQYKYINMSLFIKDYYSRVSKADDFKDYIKSKDRTDHINNNFDEIERNLNDLIKLVKELEKEIREASPAIKKSRNRERIRTAFQIFAVIIAVSALIVAIYFGITKMLGSKHNKGTNANSNGTTQSASMPGALNNSKDSM